MPRKDPPAARIALGKNAWDAVNVYGHPEGGELGIAIVEITGDIEGLQHLLPDTAEQLAQGLLLAVRLARGEAVATALDELLAKR